MYIFRRGESLVISALRTVTVHGSLFLFNPDRALTATVFQACVFLSYNVFFFF